MLLSAGAPLARRNLVASLVVFAIGGSLLAAGCAPSPEAEQTPAPEPEPVIALGADSFLVYEGEPRRLRDVFVLEVRKPLVVRRIDGRRVERGAVFYHFLPGEYSVDVDYFVGEVDRAGPIARDAGVIRWQLVTGRLRLIAHAGEGGKLEGAIEDGAVTPQLRRGKTVLVEDSVLIY